MDQELNKYAEELHALNPELNISCYEVYSKLEEVNDAPAISFAFIDPLSVSQTKLQSYLNALKGYSLSLERLNYFVNNNPWDGLSVRVSGFEYTEQMKSELEAFTNSINDCIEVLSIIYESPDICDQAQYISILEIAELIENICVLPQIPEIWLGAFNFEQGIKSAFDAKNTYTKLSDLREAISKVFVDTIYHYNYNEWKEKLLAQANGLVDLPLINRKDSEFFVKEAVTLHAHFTSLKNAFMLYILLLNT